MLHETVFHHFILIQDKTNAAVITLKNDNEKVPVDINKWVKYDANHSFSEWRSKQSSKSETSTGLPTGKTEVITLYTFFLYLF